MADITMCSNDRCPKRNTCYRQTATPNEYMQAVADFVYVLDEDSGEFFCSHYWEAETRH